MKLTHWGMSAAVLMLFGLVGCDRGTTGSAPPAHIPADTNRPNAQTPGGGNVEVNTGPGGVDVDVNRNRPSTGKGVDVDVKPGGGVDVNVNGPAIREGIQERRAERAIEP